MSSEPPFDKIVRSPPAGDRPREPYFGNTDQWVARCRARLLQLDALLKTDEADAIVWEMSQLERWRVMEPEQAADQIYRPVITRA